MTVNKGGRPTKYREEMCQVAIDMMAEGASKYEVCAEIGIKYDTFLAYLDTESTVHQPMFLDAVKKGELLSRAWWEKHSRMNLQNKDFNSTLWYMNMKNRFKWRDKHEITGEDGKDLMPREIKITYE